MHEMTCTHPGRLAIIPTIVLSLALVSQPTVAQERPSPATDKVSEPRSASPTSAADSQRERPRPPISGGRALPGSVGPLLERAFGRFGPTWTLKNANIQGDRVDAVICRDAKTNKDCHGLLLGDPERDCGGDKVGPWCLTWKGSAPDDLKAKAKQALAADTAKDVWISVNVEPEETQQETDAEAPVGQALLLLFGLLLGGVLLSSALVLIPSEPGRRAAFVLLLIAPWAGLLPPSGSLPTYGAWDWMIAAVLWDTGMLLTLPTLLLRRTWRWTVTLFCAILLVLAGVEGLLGPGDHEPKEPSGFVHWDAQASTKRACSLLYPEQFPGVDQAFSTAHDQPSPTVHFGSALLYSDGWSARDEFKRDLERSEPGSRHVVEGLGHGALDFQLLALQQLAKRNPMQRVVLHLTTEKDIAELDAPSSCCDAQSLLTYVPSGAPATAPLPAGATSTTPLPTATARCDSPRWRETLGLYLSSSPPPFILQALAGEFELARRSAKTINGLSLNLNPATRLWARSPGATWRHAEAAMIGIRDALAQQHIPLTVVLLPYPDSLEGKPELVAEFRARHDNLLAMMERIGVEHIDAWQFFNRSASETQNRPLFRGRAATGYELTSEGRVVFFDWLAKRLGERSAGSRR